MGVTSLLLEGAALAVAWSGDEGIAWIVPTMAPLVGCALVGLVLSIRVSPNPVGWLFLGTSLLIGLGKFSDAFAGVTSAAFAQDAANVAASLFEPLVLFVLPALLLFFPDGRLPSRRWRPVAWLLVAALVSFMVGECFSPGIVVPDSGRHFINPIGLGGRAGNASGLAAFLGLIFLLALMLAGAASLIVRYRHATGLLRLQLKWFGATASILALVVVGLPISWILAVPNTAYSVLLATAATGLVVASGVAVLRYRLYDIDVIIRKTLVYTALAVTLAILYLGGITLMTQALRSVSGQSSALAVTVSTLAVAAAFQPVRSRIQRAVDRRFYRRKYDGARTLQEFSGHLREHIDLDALGAELISVVYDTVQPSHASLWLQTRSPTL